MISHLDFFGCVTKPLYQFFLSEMPRGTCRSPLWWMRTWSNCHTIRDSGLSEVNNNAKPWCCARTIKTAKFGVGCYRMLTKWEAKVCVSHGVGSTISVAYWFVTMTSYLNQIISCCTTIIIITGQSLLLQAAHRCLLVANRHGSRHRIQQFRPSTYIWPRGGWRERAVDDDSSSL